MNNQQPILRIRVFFDPWIRVREKSGSEMNIQDHFPRAFKQFFGLKIKILKFFDANPDPGSRIFLTWIQDGKIQGSGIRHKHPG
jgi:hypothetical protein